MVEEKKDAPAVKEGEIAPKKDEVVVGDIVIPEVSKDKQIAQDQKRRAEKAEAEIAISEASVIELRDQITKLKTAGVTGEKSAHQVNDELKRLANEHNIDESFLTQLVSTVRTATTREIREELDKDYTPKLAKIENERSQEKMNVQFNELYSSVLKDMPEYSSIVNKSVIKSLAFNPENAKKTLPQILEEAYGAALTGKKSIETSRFSREQESPDFDNPSKEDWDKIENDPKSKEEWSKKTEAQIKRYL